MPGRPNRIAPNPRTFATSRVIEPKRTALRPGHLELPTITALVTTSTKPATRNAVMTISLLSSGTAQEVGRTASWRSTPVVNILNDNGALIWAEGPRPIISCAQATMREGPPRMIVRATMNSAGIANARPRPTISATSPSSFGQAASIQESDRRLPLPRRASARGRACWSCRSRQSTSACRSIV